MMKSHIYKYLSFWPLCLTIVSRFQFLLATATSVFFSAKMLGRASFASRILIPEAASNYLLNSLEPIKPS